MQNDNQDSVRLLAGETAHEFVILALIGVIALTFLPTSIRNPAAGAAEPDTAQRRCGLAGLYHILPDHDCRAHFDRAGADRAAADLATGWIICISV